jgi:hypothetical protein
MVAGARPAGVAALISARRPPHAVLLVELGEYGAVIVAAIFAMVTVAFLVLATGDVMPVGGDLGHEPPFGPDDPHSSRRSDLRDRPAISRNSNFDRCACHAHAATLGCRRAYCRPEDATVNLNFVGLPGTVVFVAAILAALLAGLPARKTVRLFGETIVQMTPSLLAISFMVALAYVTRYSGMDTIMGLSLTGTGWLFPFFGTLLGWLGVALTGTDAGSNALFGNLQKVTAGEQLGLSPILMGAANTTGGVMGKMIDAQSIVVATSATHQQGNEAAIFKAVFWHSIVLVSLVGGIVMLYAYVIPHLIP